MGSRWVLGSVAVVCLQLTGGHVTFRHAAESHRPRAASPDDSVVAHARAALDAGRPWAATRLLAPVVRDSARRSPASVMLAARAAAAWGGWDEVQRLLQPVAARDSVGDGDVAELLARAALGRSSSSAGDSAAVVHARMSLRGAPVGSARGTRLVLLARALERARRFDEARSAYLEAAQLLPGVGDWLRLRAAVATADSGARRGLYSSVTTEVARERTAWVEAAALERVGDFVGAARAYAALDAPVAAIRVRLAAGAPDSVRRASRAELVGLVTSRRTAAEAREAVALLDAQFRPLRPAEELAVARSAAVTGPVSRARSGFAASLGAGMGTARDRFTYGTLLSQERRDREAAEQFASAGANRELAGAAAYQRARSLLRAGAGAEALAALGDIPVRHATDTGAASSALYLRADLASDEGRDAEARAVFRRLATRYPTSARSGAAQFRAALIALVLDSAMTAAQELDHLAAQRTDETVASLYWAGRAWARAGDTVRARARWGQVLERDRGSYYAVLAGRRLAPGAGEGGRVSVSWSEGVRGRARADSVLARVALLDTLGLAPERQRELAWLDRVAERSAEALLGTAIAYVDHGFPSRAMVLGRRLAGRPEVDRVALDRVLFPLAHHEILDVEAARHGLDPWLVLALIRQESAFDPAATSRAGARGLMQLMPAVGADVANALDFPLWHDALLYQPDANIQLGTAHLAALLTRYRDVTHVLAAYNAGTSRVDRWMQKGGAADDPEMFVERIPFQETRDYVRIVLRNRARYRTLYGG